VADQGSQSSHGPNGQWELPPSQLAKNSVWADGTLAISSTSHANMHVGLLNLLSADVFSDGQKCDGG